MDNAPFAEVIESSLSSWTAQCWQWNRMPSFGSLVTINHQSRILFGIVHHIQTGSLDAVRMPFAYQKTHEELLQEQPQIFEFLKTTFSCIIVGYAVGERIWYHLAPEPPLIHSFIHPASQNQVHSFFKNTGYLPLLFQTAQSLAYFDELLLALVQTWYKTHAQDQAFLEQFFETFSLLCGNDYRRIKLFVQRLQSVGTQ